MTPLEIQSYFETIKKLVFEYSPKFVIAIIILLAGLWFTSFITKSAKKIMSVRNVELTLSTFIGNLIFWTLRILLFVTVISKLGIETSAFVTILGAAGLAIGLSLQGSLSNFAGGILIILFKPFRIGDFIEAQNVSGTVKDIKIFSTVITSPDNKQIVIPNAALSNGVIINYTVNGIRRVDLIISVDYGTDLQLAKDTIFNVLDTIPEILKDPETAVFINNLASSSIDFAVRPFTENENYWKVKSDVLEKIKIAFDKAGIEIPYPHQVEIHKE
ncbi:mechanosensitive ion channel family protein [Flavobacterium cucumis]|uniref:Small conductance mechanosensitive channel n=1 Tax=Flavobacterium cucumis TaxID=416016 RepID=A0A1M7ZTH9_9FLAO|nr:mechanosensitive ion channel domain-containing protein [Flavobacterium cucumis]SHO72070.1 small conductance mechanosensitive channel [Flavobacterium cucumis]